MRTVSFRVADRICDDCSLALRRYLDGIEGVASVDADGRNMAVLFDEEVINGDAVITAARDSLEKLGHRLAM
jgi:copper chaperone CopZ